MKLQLQFVLLFCLSVLTSQNSFSQNESTNWYFGINAGLSFTSGTPVALTNGALSTHEGVATVSDTSGNLLFYTDGITVYNSQHNAMQNGTGLQGDPSSTQSAIILKKPYSYTLYYIFTMSDVTGGIGLRYSIVDMALNSGLGTVTSKNIAVAGNTREKLTSVKHANGIDYWILINDWNTDEIKAFLFDSSGVSTTPVVSNAGPIRYGAYSNALGYMKASRQKDKLAFANWTQGRFIVVGFDNNTGMADSSQRIEIGPVASYSYGVEFSPDGNKLYGTVLSGSNLLLQFDLTSGNDSLIFNTCDTIASENNFPCSAFRFGALQLGPDGKIYGVNVCDSSLLVINFPDQPAASCGFVLQGVSLAGRTCDLGLPNLISDQVFPVSVTDIVRENSILIYPNPATEILNIENTETGAEMKIVNAMGEILCSKSAIGTKTQINTSNWPAGMYFLYITSKHSAFCRKVICSK